MGVTTWLDRITDEGNVWLSAVRAEDATDFEAASNLYLHDAANHLVKGYPIRSALSCSCAANCLMKAGATEDGRHLYLEAGRMYHETAETKVSLSIREGLWALEKAYECFVLAGNTKESEATRKAFDLLARRANPFSVGTEQIEFPKVRQHFSAPVQDWVKRSDGPTWKALDAFLDLRRELKSEDAPRRLRADDRSGEDLVDQESIVSQLG